MPAAAVLLSLPLLLGSAVPALSEGFLPGYAEDAVPTGRLLSRGWSARDRQRLEHRLPEILGRVERKIGRELGEPFTTILVPDRQELARVVERLGGRLGDSSRVLGVALPSVRCLVVREGLLPGSSPFEDTLGHEVAHLVLHRRLDVQLPRWFDEGVATWASGAVLAPDDEAYLSLLARLGALHPLEKLEVRFPAGHAETSTAYHQSYLLISYLAWRHGERIVPELLEAFEAGATPRQALEARTGRSLETLEREFAAWVVARRSFLMALASVVSIWTLISLAALVVVLRAWLVRRRKLAQLEPGSPPDPEDVSPSEASS